jgi:hypothetical protein
MSSRREYSVLDSSTGTSNTTVIAIIAAVIVIVIVGLTVVVPAVTPPPVVVEPPVVTSPPVTTAPSSKPTAEILNIQQERVFKEPAALTDAQYKVITDATKVNLDLFNELYKNATKNIVLPYSSLPFSNMSLNGDSQHGFKHMKHHFTSSIPSSSPAFSVGSSQPVFQNTLPVKRPNSGSKCVAPLFTSFESNINGTYTQQSLAFNYITPADCVNAKMAVLEMDFEVPGSQVSLGWQLWIKNVYLAVGVTQFNNPSLGLSNPKWSVEKDITHLINILRTNGVGLFSLPMSFGNSAIFSSARIVLYNSDTDHNEVLTRNPADIVLGLTSSTVQLVNTNPGTYLTKVFTGLPSNIEKLHLEISQRNFGPVEESFYLQLNVRALTVLINGVPVALRACFPYIYTNSINGMFSNENIGYRTTLLGDIVIDLTPYAASASSGFLVVTVLIQQSVTNPALGGHYITGNLHIHQRSGVTNVIGGITNYQFPIAPFQTIAYYPGFLVVIDILFGNSICGYVKNLDGSNRVDTCVNSRVSEKLVVVYDNYGAQTQMVNMERIPFEHVSSESSSNGQMTLLNKEVFIRKYPFVFNIKTVYNLYPTTSSDFNEEYFVSQNIYNQFKKKFPQVRDFTESATMTSLRTYNRPTGLSGAYVPLTTRNTTGCYHGNVVSDNDDIDAFYLREWKGDNYRLQSAALDTYFHKTQDVPKYKCRHKGPVFYKFHD